MIFLVTLITANLELIATSKEKGYSFYLYRDLSKLSLSGFACLSSGSLYTMGIPGAEGDSANITLSPE